MKVGFINSVPFSFIYGGGETQATRTLEELQKLGVDAERFDPWKLEFDYSILHFLGCKYWFREWVFMAKGKGAKIVVSPIAYMARPTLGRKLFGLVDPWLPIRTTFRLHKEILQVADMLLPNSHAEAEQLVRYFGVEHDRIRVVYNATDTSYCHATPDEFGERYGISDFVLCVGKIEPRKNQLNLLRALKGTGRHLVLIGGPIPNVPEYFQAVKALMTNEPNLLHIPFLPPGSTLLGSAYAAAKVHALVGFNETPGIAALEAGLAGANLVNSNTHPVREYFKDASWYCNPHKLDSIHDAVTSAMDAPRNGKARKLISERYTWERAARDTLKAYESIS
jgi:glycosyltransferase involved in cell wall biosynthesis